MVRSSVAVLPDSGGHELDSNATRDGAYHVSGRAAVEKLGRELDVHVGRGVSRPGPPVAQAAAAYTGFCQALRANALSRGVFAM